MQQNLSKENFFNPLMEKHPEAVQRFCDWIDQYKIDNNWIELFNADWDVFANGRGPGKDEAPKFHDLPLAMQVGILLEYFGWAAARVPDDTPDFIDPMAGWTWAFRWHFEHNTIPQRELIPS